MCCDNKGKAKLLSDQFKSVFIRESLSDIPEMERRMRSISEISINEEIVRKKLNKLKEDKTKGPDGIHPKVLKECAEQLTGPLTKLFNLSLSQ